MATLEAEVKELREKYGKLDRGHQSMQVKKNHAGLSIFGMPSAMLVANDIYFTDDSHKS